MVNRRFLGLLLRAMVLWCCGANVAVAQPQLARKTIGFSNLVFRLAGSDQLGIATDDFRVHILEELRGRGVNAIGAENLVFGSEHGHPPDLMLGGIVTELQCQQGASYMNVSCRMGVEWQVLDVESDKILYQVLSRSRVLEMPRNPAISVGKRLVLASATGLSQRPQFQKLFDALPTAAPTRGYARATLRACKASPRSMPQASEQVLDASVLVQTSGGFGSGFVLGPDGFVVTAAHVVPESSATIKLRDGREFPATVIRVDRRIDIALLRLGTPEGTPLPCLPVKADPVPVGADVYAIGSPASRDLSFSLARGIVSGVRLLQGLQYLQTDAAVNSGNSGGPLVTGSGEAAAIVSFKLVGASVEGVAFGVPLGPGLNALGVVVGNGFTSPELASAGAAPAPPAPQLFVDTPDPLPTLASPPAPRSTHVQGVGARRTSPAVKRAFYVWGGTALITGLTLFLGVTLAGSAGNDETGHKLKNIGLGTSAVGGVLLGIGFALP